MLFAWHPRGSCSPAGHMQSGFAQADGLPKLSASIPQALYPGLWGEGGKEAIGWPGEKEKAVEETDSQGPPYCQTALLPPLSCSLEAHRQPNDSWQMVQAGHPGGFTPPLSERVKAGERGSEGLGTGEVSCCRQQLFTCAFFAGGNIARKSEQSVRCSCRKIQSLAASTKVRSPN